MTSQNAKNIKKQYCHKYLYIENYFLSIINFNIQI